MFDQFKEFLKILKEQEEQDVINLSDPEDLYRFDLRFKLMHKNFANFDEKFMRGAHLLIQELDNESCQNNDK